MKQINILLLGAGGDIGQSVFKVLNEIDWVDTISGTDINQKTASKLLFNHFFIVPRCNDETYLDSISKIIKEENISIIIPISEPEIRYFHQKGIIEIAKVPLVLANRFSLTVALEKLATIDFLKKNNLPHPKAQQLDQPITMDYPLIAKSNKGSGSKNIVWIEDELDLTFVKRKHPGHILQEFLPADEGEYTCGLFRSSQGEIRQIVFKRDLMSGFSVYGEVVENEQINVLLVELATKLELRGSINVQLRLVEGIPKIFEINPRFSSTVRFRDLLGFKDILWVLEDHLNEQISNYNKPPLGAKFFKGFEEYIL
jgi:carbamoyl-phosphate synthase large subunit